MYGNFKTLQQKKPHRRGVSSGFTLIELIVVIAIIGMLFSIVLAVISSAQRDAKDKRRVSDLKQLQNALELYYTDHRSYPKESQGANGNTATNETFRSMLEPYLSGYPQDPINNATFYYYYDGKHRCGTKDFAVIFARSMEVPENSNYTDFLNNTCGGVLDGEGRGGGTSSYSILLGYSGD